MSGARSWPGKDNLAHRFNKYLVIRNSIHRFIWIYDFSASYALAGILSIA
ncbi:hypothetical protein CSC33_0772 [Pseudomonas aeruginosa]|nr:hypothetical protein CSC33_0772 [Pseudomonas aeruginosa]